MKKKIFAMILLLSLTLAFAFVGCGENADNTGLPNTDTMQESTGDSSTDAPDTSGDESNNDSSDNSTDDSTTDGPNSDGDESNNDSSDNSAEDERKPVDPIENGGNINNT